jgi:hypothetical protein
LESLGSWLRGEPDPARRVRLACPTPRRQAAQRRRGQQFLVRLVVVMVTTAV